MSAAFDPSVFVLKPNERCEYKIPVSNSQFKSEDRVCFKGDYGKDRVGIIKHFDQDKYDVETIVITDPDGTTQTLKHTVYEVPYGRIVTVPPPGKPKQPIRENVRAALQVRGLSQASAIPIDHARVIRASAIRASDRAEAIRRTLQSNNVGNENFVKKNGKFAFPNNNNNSSLGGSRVRRTANYKGMKNRRKTRRSRS